jgi:release factor glutamine methyltransferase
MADIGAGCGCIAVSLALHLPRATIHATDISEDALELARLNAGRHGASERITFHAGDACRALPVSLRGRIQMIVSNPPYVTDAEYADLSKGIRNFEPAVALRGGADGLEVFRRIAAGAADFLSPGGALAVETGESQGEAASGILENAGGFADIKTIRDLAGRIRVITCRRTT